MPCLLVSRKSKICAEADALFVYQTFVIVGERVIRRRRSPPSQAASVPGSRGAAALLAGAASPNPLDPSALGHQSGVTERERQRPGLITRMRLAISQVRKSASELKNLQGAF